MGAGLLLAQDVDEGRQRLTGAGRRLALVANGDPQALAGLVEEAVVLLLFRPQGAEGRTVELVAQVRQVAGGGKLEAVLGGRCLAA